MSKIFVSSDWHLNHKNITGPKVSQWDNGYRNFDTTEEMNEIIIKAINNTVAWDDILYFLGDFCFGNHKLTPNWRNRINCQTIHVCRGNHDNYIDTYKESFTSIQDVLTFQYNKQNFFCSHYSHRVWLGSHKGYIHLYGHSHDSISDYSKSMDVGIDVAKRLTAEYRPFNIDEIVDIMKNKEIAIIDHHNNSTNVH